MRKGEIMTKVAVHKQNIWTIYQTQEEAARALYVSRPMIAHALKGKLSKASRLKDVIVIPAETLYKDIFAAVRLELPLDRYSSQVLNQTLNFLFIIAQKQGWNSLYHTYPVHNYVRALLIALEI